LVNRNEGEPQKQMPKLIIRVFGDSGEDIYDLKEASKYLNFTEQVVSMNGKRISSLEEFLQITAQPEFRGREYIEVTIISAIDGG
jgi:hypothetical protein